MKKWSIILAACLAIQVVLAVGVNMARTRYNAFEPTEDILVLILK